jgi:hypothetical protein
MLPEAFSVSLFPFFRIKDSRLCGNVIDFRDRVGSSVVVAHVCTLPKGHDGHHQDNAGFVWINGEWILRQRGNVE